MEWVRQCTEGIKMDNEEMTCPECKTKSVDGKYHSECASEYYSRFENSDEYPEEVEIEKAHT